MGARLADPDVTFFRGAKSDSDPGQLPLGYYWSGLNVINQGGVISCRPGNHCLITFPGGKLQGAAIFKPKLGLERMLAAVEGRVFVAEYPFLVYKQLTNIQFSPHAKQLFFTMTEQTAQRLTTDQTSAIEAIAPKAVMIMQDGGFTAPAFYDGSDDGHIRNNLFETPAGGPMVWIGDRLWVAIGSAVKASDIGNPFSFREELYLGGADAFLFDSDVTAMVATPSLDIPQLLVFTESKTSIIQANVRERNTWNTIANFQREIFNVGCVSNRSVVSHFGQLMWFSSAGIVFFDSAALAQQSARLPIRDNEMAISKINIGGDLGLIAGAAFGQYLLMSVPSGDLFNKETWVLNGASLETLTDASGPSWAGVWTGTRPVQWVFGTIAGKERIYHVSTDEDGENRLWEAFTPDRLDNGCPITWAVELRGYFGQTTQSQKPPGEEVEFRYAKVALTAIEETLDFGVFYAGGMRGAYKQILNRRIRASRGNIDTNVEITADSLLFAFKAQSRTLRTADVKSVLDDETGSCPVERHKNENVDESFQLLLVGHGPATVRWVCAYADAEIDDQGDPETPCGVDEPYRAIRFDGYGAKADTLLEASTTLAAKLTNYTSNQTITADYRGAQATGIGFAESIISQDAADRVAQRIAAKSAENEVVRQLPSIFSAGVSDE